LRAQTLKQEGATMPHGAFPNFPTGYLTVVAHDGLLERRSRPQLAVPSIHPQDNRHIE